MYITSHTCVSASSLWCEPQTSLLSACCVQPKKKTTHHDESFTSWTVENFLIFIVVIGFVMSIFEGEVVASRTEEMTGSGLTNGISPALFVQTRRQSAISQQSHGQVQRSRAGGSAGVVSKIHLGVFCQTYSLSITQPNTSNKQQAAFVTQTLLIRW